MLITQLVYLFYQNCLAKTFICNLEHSVSVSFDSVRFNFLFVLPELKFIFKVFFWDEFQVVYIISILARTQ